MEYITGSTIRSLREKRSMTQRQLADRLLISDKTVSKWETGKGLPDVGILTELAGALGVSVAELLSGAYAENTNRSGNMKKMGFYVCPVCGNIIASLGEGSYSCCGILLPRLTVEEADPVHTVKTEVIDDELFVSLDHEMTKSHYISFFAYVTSDTVQMKKLYPEQSAESRFARRGHGYLYACCNRHGLFRILV